jgi:AraC-like DNA-binding protein
MSPNKPTTHGQASSIGSAVILVDRALRTYGINPEALFQKAGIDFKEATMPGARLDSADLYELYRVSVEVTGDPCFGLKVSEQLQPANLHGLGFAWLASDNLFNALERLVRFSKLINNVARFRLELTEQTIELIAYDLDKLPDHPDSVIDSIMAIFLKMCRITAGSSFNPIRLDLAHSPPVCSKVFDLVFRAPIRFNAADNRLCFDRASLEASLPSSNPELARINDQSVIDYLARFDRDNVSIQVRTRIIEQLPAGTPRQAIIAKELNISLRSMQRKLKAEGTSFNSLIDGTRRELAMYYIRETHRPLGEISYLLGFSEPSNFTRAFRRWAGTSPQDFRNDAVS